MADRTLMPRVDATSDQLDVLCDQEGGQRRPTSRTRREACGLRSGCEGAFVKVIQAVPEKTKHARASRQRFRSRRSPQRCRAGCCRDCGGRLENPNNLRWGGPGVS